MKGETGIYLVRIRKDKRGSNCCFPLSQGGLKGGLRQISWRHTAKCRQAASREIVTRARGTIQNEVCYVWNRYLEKL